jgi:hypothetical protein
MKLITSDEFIYESKDQPSIDRINKLIDQANQLVQFAKQSNFDHMLIENIQVYLNKLNDEKESMRH